MSPHQTHLLDTVGHLGRPTLRQLCEEVAQATGGTIHGCYKSIRAELDQYVRAGTVVCWSTAKPMYVLAHDAPRLWSELKAHLYEAICRRGQATPGRLKSVPLGGAVIAMDLMQDLAQELMDEGKIVNVGRKGTGRTKIYVPVENNLQQEMDLGAAGQVLRYLKKRYDNNFFRETALKIASELKLAREEVDNALRHLEERGLLEITQNGFLKMYGYAARTMVIRQVDPGTLSYGHVVYAQPAAEQPTTPTPETHDDVRPAQRQRLAGLTQALRTRLGSIGQLMRVQVLQVVQVVPLRAETALLLSPVPLGTRDPQVKTPRREHRLRKEIIHKQAMTSLPMEGGQSPPSPVQGMEKTSTAPAAPQNRSPERLQKAWAAAKAWSTPPMRNWGYRRPMPTRLPTRQRHPTYNRLHPLASAAASAAPWATSPPYGGVTAPFSGQG
ncbi:hypothetical protein [Deinococcus multiflagellatus]|uniref:Uncharacterized protein n=1 Tax=Deinococcus multiflagellatus TaxID=1656887 RepID=A0ABW1ZSE7_9DEIO|nr:hypothetical protein [Deinococcus multiflagellatus]MBZ9714952.1 hypothetical protein [Deinococcus multiflagellatus]